MHPCFNYVIKREDIIYLTETEREAVMRYSKFGHSPCEIEFISTKTTFSTDLDSNQQNSKEWQH